MLTRKREEILSRLSAVQSLKINENNRDNDYQLSESVLPENNVNCSQAHELMIHRIATSLFSEETTDPAYLDKLDYL